MFANVLPLIIKELYVSNNNLHNGKGRYNDALKLRN